MTIYDFCVNMTDKAKYKCFRCLNLGIASHFEGNVNAYVLCCIPLQVRITEDIKDCPFEEIDEKELKSHIEIYCAQHGIPVPDWIREL